MGWGSTIAARLRSKTLMPARAFSEGGGGAAERSAVHPVSPESSASASGRSRRCRLRRTALTSARSGLSFTPGIVDASRPPALPLGLERLRIGLHECLKLSVQINNCDRAKQDGITRTVPLELGRSLHTARLSSGLGTIVEPFALPETAYRDARRGLHRGARAAEEAECEHRENTSAAIGGDVIVTRKAASPPPGRLRREC